MNKGYLLLGLIFIVGCMPTSFDASNLNESEKELIWGSIEKTCNELDGEYNRTTENSAICTVGCIRNYNKIDQDGWFSTTDMEIC